MCVPVGGCCPLWFGGAGGLVVCWRRAAWGGHCPIVGWWLGCWCGGVHVCVCCLEADAPMVCLVCWLFGGLVVGGVCGVWFWRVGVCGVLLRVLHPLWLCVCVGDVVCWWPCMCVPERLLPPVGWWCWCVGGVLPGALPPIKGWCVGDVVCWCPCMCVHEWVVAPLWCWWCWWCDAWGKAP